MDETEKRVGFFKHFPTQTVWLFAWWFMLNESPKKMGVYWQCINNPKNLKNMWVRYTVTNRDTHQSLKFDNYHQSLKKPIWSDELRLPILLKYNKQKPFLFEWGIDILHTTQDSGMN